MQDPDASFHHLPSDPARRASWLARGETTQGPVTSVLLLPPARGNFQECVVASSSSWELSGPYRATTTSMLVQHGNLA